MRSVQVSPGQYISPDKGLSDDFIVTTVDSRGRRTEFHIEPREWLAEWECVFDAKLPVGARYSNQLLVSAQVFEMKILGRDWDQRLYQFTVWNVLSHSQHTVTFDEKEILNLASEIRHALDS